MDFKLPRAAIERLVGRLEDHQADQLSAYGRAILDASPRVNLVSRKSLDAVPEHLVDSAALLAFTDPLEGAIADLGTGAGLPGIVLAILRPQTQVFLIDSRRSKAVFLKDVRRRLGLPNVEVLHKRIEELAGEARYPFVTARALGDSAEVLPACLRVVEPGGRLVLFKGPAWAEESEKATAVAMAEGADVVRTETIELPGLGRSTTFVEFHVKQA